MSVCVRCVQCSLYTVHCTVYILVHDQHSGSSSPRPVAAPAVDLSVGAVIDCGRVKVPLAGVTAETPLVPVSPGGHHLLSVEDCEATPGQKGGAAPRPLTSGSRCPSLQGSPGRWSRGGSQSCKISTCEEYIRRLQYSQGSWFLELSGPSGHQCWSLRKVVRSLSGQSPFIVNIPRQRPTRSPMCCLVFPLLHSITWPKP